MSLNTLIKKALVNYSMSCCHTCSLHSCLTAPFMNWSCCFMSNIHQTLKVFSAKEEPTSVFSTIFYIQNMNIITMSFLKYNTFTITTWKNTGRIALTEQPHFHSGVIHQIIIRWNKTVLNHWMFSDKINFAHQTQHCLKAQSVSSSSSQTFFPSSS